MRRLILTIVCSGLLASAQADETLTAPERLSRAREVLAASAAPDPHRRQALDELRRLAAGDLEDATTREANFAIAAYWLPRLREVAGDKALRATAAACSLYQDDARTPPILAVLARVQVERGDRFGAHISFKQLLERTDDLAAELLVLAAENAAAVGDVDAAYAWCARIDVDALEADSATRYHLAMLKSAEALGRTDEALPSAKRLRELVAEPFYLDAEAVLAAARLFAASNRLALATELYTYFANVHVASGQHPSALLALGELLARTGDIAQASRYISWCVERYPGTPMATEARLRLLEVDGRPADPTQIETYVAIIRDAPDMTTGRAACDRFVERFLAAGHPLELLAALAHLIDGDAQSDNNLGPLVARDAATRAAAPILFLLHSRQDTVALAAASLELERTTVPIPLAWREAVDAARSAVGLPPAVSGPFDTALREARAHRRAGAWPEVRLLLHSALRSPAPIYPPSEAAALVLLAEALWRENEIGQALDTLDEAIPRFAISPEGRALHVMRADLLFAEGDREGACADYRAAASRGGSRWVDRQVAACGPPSPTTEKRTS